MSAAPVPAAASPAPAALPRIRYYPAPSVVTVDFEEWFCVCGDDWYS